MRTEHMFDDGPDLSDPRVAVASYYRAVQRLLNALGNQRFNATFQVAWEDLASLNSAVFLASTFDLRS
ncbi:MAG: hypothetical protein ACQSGP_14040 [Frankia sp.]